MNKALEVFDFFVDYSLMVNYPVCPPEPDLLDHKALKHNEEVLRALMSS